MTVKQEALVIEKASEELEEIDEEVALILTDFQFPNQGNLIRGIDNCSGAP